MLRHTGRIAMKYANLELTTRGEFPHGMSQPAFVKKLDKNIPWFFSTYRSMYHWPVVGDNWSDLNESEKHHDLHMYYTLAWWKLGEGIFEADDDDRAMLRMTCRRVYRYQEFEMHRPAQFPVHYPREAPNTSAFPQLQSAIWMWYGYGRQEVWIDTEGRRYETTWQMLRRLLMWIIPFTFIFPFGLAGMLSCAAYGEYGERPCLDAASMMPFDNHYIEQGYSTLDAEWLRHIHSTESY